MYLDRYLILRNDGCQIAISGKFIRETKQLRTLRQWHNLLELLYRVTESRTFFAMDITEDDISVHGPVTKGFYVTESPDGTLLPKYP